MNAVQRVEQEKPRQRATVFDQDGAVSDVFSRLMLQIGPHTQQAMRGITRSAEGKERYPVNLR